MVELLEKLKANSTEYEICLLTPSTNFIGCQNRKNFGRILVLRDFLFSIKNDANNTQMELYTLSTGKTLSKMKNALLFNDKGLDCIGSILSVSDYLVFEDICDKKFMGKKVSGLLKSNIYG